MNLLTGPLRPPARHRKHGWPDRHIEHGPLADWNNDPQGGGWTGYDDVIAGMHAGLAMVDKVVMTPATVAQYGPYSRMQNTAIELGYERRPPAPHGTSAIHVHFERASGDAAVSTRTVPPSDPTGQP
jgi:hypothetical protein